MVSGNHPMDSFFNSLDAVKGALSPLESGIRRTAKDLELCWADNLELFPELNFTAENSRRSSYLKKKQCEDVVFVGDRKESVSIKFPIKTLLRTFFVNSGANERRVGLLKKGSKEKESVGEKVSCTNCLQFAVTWSLLLSSFVQAFPSPFKNGRKRLQTQGALDNCCSDAYKESTSSGVASKPKRREYGQFAGSFQKKGTTCKEGDSLSLQFLIGLIFGQFSQNLQKFDQGILTGEKADVDYILGNLRFARVGGVPPSLVGVTSSAKVEDEYGLSAGNREETEGGFPQKLANGFEAATVAIVPSVEVPAGSVLKSALAGGLSCALSAFLMHPIDTVKTQVQASTTLSLPELVSKLPQIGVQGLYRGSIPAILGQFSSHGLRTGICEASKLVLVNVAPTLPEIQVETVASFCSTILGTVARIPCEVLKQRLQAGIYENVGEAIVDTLRQDGIRGFFRGTGATLCREVPFYVAGMGLYAESKKVVQKLLKRDLEPWESMVVGAISGGLASVTTTPFDVIKTRMMIASQGMPVSMSMMAFSILRQEGPLALFKGVVPRFFWVAPLGAINLAGYELLRKAMDKT